MLDAGKVAQPLTHHVGRQPERFDRQCGRQRVTQIVQSGQGEFRLRHGERCRLLENKAPTVSIGHRAGLGRIGKGQHPTDDVVLRQFAAYVFVTGPIDKCVVGRLIAENAHLGVDVVLHFEVVAVEVVGRNVEQYGHIGTEVVHVVQLKRRQLNDVVGVRRLGNL